MPQANSLLVDLIAKAFDISDSKERVEELRNGFPFGLLQSILLTVIFYLMVNLHHRALSVLRNYQYLAAIESELRQHLSLPRESVFFTREGAFYKSSKGPLSVAVKWFYVAFLGLLLLAFLLGRVVDDFRGGNVLLAIVDMLIAMPTLIFYYAYALSSVSKETKQAKVQSEVVE